MLGDKINEFDRSNGTVEDFNRIFDKTPLDLDKNDSVEILEIPIGDTLKRYIMINDTEKIVHCFNKYAHVLSEQKAEMINADNFYIVKNKGVIIFKAFTMEELAKKMKVKISFINKRLTNKPIRSKKMQKKFKHITFEKILQ